ncbi:glycoside hydrolase family 3 N-terminal domain-containing protein [Erythrobacter sp.]|uniref:glycoside hydrolase family 3 protein n=1 Tax=Erythrobacter sp. TaxID=1042 RepID=UPI003C73C806
MRGRFVRSSLLAGVVAFGVVGCAPYAGQELESASTLAPSSASERINPSIWPDLNDPVPTDPAVEARVAQLLAAMSLEQKVGQIIQADIGSITPEEAATYHLGSVLNGGNSAPGGKPFATGPEWLAAADAFYRASTQNRSDPDTPIIPIIWGSDAVHGHNNVIGATIFPHNIGLGAMRDPALMRRIGEITAIEMRVTGLDWTFAPTLAVPRDDRWGRTYEGFSEDPDLVASYAAPLVEGLQGEIGDPDWLRGDHIVATAKHFVGDGGTDAGRDQGDATVSEENLRDVQAAGYVPAIEAGVQSIMVSFSSWNGKKITGHRPLLTDVLKGRMDFGGFLVGDWNAHGQVEGCTNTSCADAVDAGLDMFMAPDSWRGLYDTTLGQARSGVISQDRLDDAVARILRVKLRSGLMDAGLPSQRANAGRFELLGAPEHRAVAREAVRRSLVLLKNDGALPLRQGQTILVAGDGADDIGKQSGGWTLTWQGTDTTRSDFPGATSIWDGLREAAAERGAEAVLSADGSYTDRPDVAVVVFGEDPYAEFQGDVPDLAFRDENDALGILRRFQEAGVPTVSIFLSGRPLWVNPHLNASDAFVAAWLPGSEGDGVADVLFGDTDFTGTLSYSWPRSALQTPLNIGDPGYDPLFPLGYGLSYASGGTVPELPEDSGIDTANEAPGTQVFARGEPGAGYRLVGEAAGRTIPVAQLAETSLDTLSARRVDLGAQEDAWRFTWSGPAAVSAVPNQPLDWTRESNGDFLLALDLRRGDSVPDTVTLSLGCGEDCAGRLDIAPALSALVPDTEATIAIPLRCFVVAGADAARLTTAASIEATGPLVLDIGRIALVSDDGADRTCPTGPATAAWSQE